MTRAGLRAAIAALVFIACDQKSVATTPVHDWPALDADLRDLDRSDTVPTPSRVGLGAPCPPQAPGECDLGLVCAAVHLDGARCARACGGGEACADGELCGRIESSAYACLPTDAAADFHCPYSPCIRSDLTCVYGYFGQEARGWCVALCADEGASCAAGGHCTRRPADGVLFCRPLGDREIGASCGNGGTAACRFGLDCHARGPGDPDAFCTRPCESPGDCGDRLACRRPIGSEQAICLPVPFGAGDEAGTPGDACSVHGQTDCLPELDCVRAIDGGSVCAAPCDGQCEPQFVCVDRGSPGRHCVSGDTGGGVGTPCPHGLGCAHTCADGAPLDRYCTVPCEPGGCPDGFHCRANWCAPGERGDRPLGADCGDEGSRVCASGVCAALDGGDSVCTRPCDDDAPCPDGFTCDFGGGVGMCRFADRD